MYRKLVIFFSPIQSGNCKIAVQVQLLMSAISVHRQPSVAEKCFFSKPVSFSLIHTQFGNLLGAWKTTYSSITGKKKKKKPGRLFIYLKHSWIWLPSNLFYYALLKKVFLLTFLEVVKSGREGRFWFYVCLLFNSVGIFLPWFAKYLTLLVSKKKIQIQVKLGIF